MSASLAWPSARRLDVLAAGPVDAAEVKRDAKAVGIGERTLDKAKASLGIRMSDYVKRVGGIAGGGRWTWELPPKGARLRAHRENEDVCALSGNPHGHTENEAPATAETAKGVHSPAMAPLASEGVLDEAERLAEKHADIAGAPNGFRWSTNERERQTQRDEIARKVREAEEAKRRRVSAVSPVVPVWSAAVRGPQTAC